MTLPPRLRPLLLALLAAALLAAGVLRAQPSRAVVVTALMPAPFVDALAPVVERFNRSHPGIRLEVSRGPFETEAISDLAIGSLLLGDSPYDLLLMDVTWTPRYAAAGWLRPLEPLLGEAVLEPLLPGAREGNRFGGHLWRVPLVADMGLLYWRTDLMSAPPRTPAELERVAGRLQRQGRVRWGYVWQGRQYEGLSCMFLEALRGFGGQWLAPGGAEARLASPAGIAAAAWLRHLIDAGITPRAVANFAEPEALQSFEAGDAAFLRNWPYAWAELQRPGSRVRGKVGVTTMVAEAGIPPAATQGSWGFSLVSQSRHPREAAAVITALTAPEVQKDLARRLGYTPSLQALFEDPELLAVNPVLPMLRQALEHTALRPLSPLYAQLSDLLQRQLSAVITGEAEPAAAMARAQWLSNQLLRASGAR
jgi:multiple sugar transport system substrate-binding protein